ncbi:hypothetical protein JTB14_028892 [Gonioctena quinquepunctata]|nr:hypothetical protein JTB14_028892 [Gonioctena quinquepunctata]
MEVYEKISCLAIDGSTRRVAIIALNWEDKNSYIFDPTIQYEMSDTQPEEVDMEKKTIYESTIPYFTDKYGLGEIKVIGLMIGALEQFQRFSLISQKISSYSKH